MKAFVIDLTHCNGCYNCQLACKDEHVGNDWTPIARPQPLTGHFWCKITELIRGQIPQVKMSYIPVLCQHCEYAPCLPACPVKGALYRRDDGLVIIDPTKCDGCKKCMDACPYGVIYFNEALNIAQKCTGCAHLLDIGWKEPRCVDACPTECMKFGDESQLSEWICKAEILNPEYGTRPRVFYVGLPKRFIAGTIYDPVTREVVIGATLTLSGEGQNFTGTTDIFGDFWFEELKAGKYFLKIEADGKTKKMDVDVTKEDKGLANIALY